MTEQIGEIFEAQVRDLASDGRGIVSHPDGRTYFVAGVWLDERIQVRITEVKGKIGIGDCAEILSPSEHRIEPPCPHHGTKAGKCGGCGWQFISYTAQLVAKQQRVVKAFERLDAADKVLPIVQAPDVLGYRNRAQFKTDGKRLGYVSPQSKVLAEIKDCIVLTDKNRSTLQALKQELPKPEWKPKKKFKWTTLDIDESVSALAVRMNQRLPFQQGNAAQNTALKQWLANKLDIIEKDKNVLELFCGSGNLTEVIVERGFQHISAVEMVQEALDDLEALGFENVQCIKADLFDEGALTAVARRCKDAQVLVLDPPRDGLKLSQLLMDGTRKLQDILYVSCDLATLNRDLQAMCSAGFNIAEVQALDMFPQTPHIELMVHLKKK
ncbi:MAG: RsmD family RNA methyltransferase [Agarilytica sp.]